jgi:hypothetical protein
MSPRYGGTDRRAPSGTGSSARLTTVDLLAPSVRDGPTVVTPGHQVAGVAAVRSEEKRCFSERTVGRRADGVFRKMFQCNM